MAAKLIVGLGMGAVWLARYTNDGFLCTVNNYFRTGAGSGNLTVELKQSIAMVLNGVDTM